MAPKSNCDYSPPKGPGFLLHRLQQAICSSYASRHKQRRIALPPLPNWTFRVATPITWFSLICRFDNTGRKSLYIGILAYSQMSQTSRPATKNISKNIAPPMDKCTNPDEVRIQISRDLIDHQREDAKRGSPHHVFFNSGL